METKAAATTEDAMMEAGLCIKTTEMHTGGEPVRIVTSGFPEIKGSTILDKRRFAKEHLDHLRTLLLHEPRGHYDMYGVLPCAPSKDKDIDFACLFVHNEGYSTMCGHATIALGRWLVDTGAVAAQEPQTTVTLEVPCGLVTATVEVKDGRAGDCSFRSVPAFAFKLDHEVTVPGIGAIRVDIGYGGAFYALVPAAVLKLDVKTSPTRDLMDAADRVTKAVRDSIKLSHPDSQDLSFLYGTILIDSDQTDDNTPSANICVFADREVDRSPCGSGVTARMAVRYAKGLVRLGQRRQFRSPTGALFSGEVVEKAKCGDRDAVIVRVGGRAYYTGKSEFTVEGDDPLRKGFLLR